jgi:DNA-binding MarR family transcriptional regulator
MADDTDPFPDRASVGTRADDVAAIEAAWRRELPGVPVDSIGVLTRIRRAAKLLGDDRRRTLARLGLDASTLDLLSTLRRSGPPYRLVAGEIARRSLITAGAVSQRVARAARAGLVRRDRSGPDGRSVVVALTPAGHDLIEASVGELLQHEQTLVSALTPADRARLAADLETLLDDLASRAGA